MASTNQSDSPSLNTINNLFGTALEFPKCFRKPGTSSHFELMSGSGHTGFNGSAATFNPNLMGGVISKMTNGMDVVNGIQTVNGALTVNGATLFNGVVNGLTASWTIETGVYSLTSGGNVSITSANDVKLTSSNITTINSPAIILNGTSWEYKKVYWDKKKDFDIPHPTKEGWRLRHVCIEGPTADVYVKGKIENSNVIELPEYWIGLVDSETITVNLTPIGAYQELFVEKIENNQIFIENNSAEMIKCYYLICGERKDTEKNIPEYKGTYDDYPGDNTQYSGSLMNILRGL